MSRHRPLLLRRSALLLALLIPAACGDGGDSEGSAAAVPEAVPLEIEPLDDDDLAGLDPAKVAINMPWGGGVVSREQTPRAARATLRDVRTEEHGAFDRLVLEFGTEAPFPGYRVAWAGSASTRCGAETPLHTGAGPRPLVIALRPARAHEDDGTPTIREPERRTRFPAVAEARQICDDAGLVEWLLGVSDSSSVRVLEMRDPPRLVVDVAHPGARAPAETPSADTASAGP